MTGARTSPRTQATPAAVGVLVLVAVGWLVLAFAYYLVLPFFGVVSPVTWTVTGLCWLWVLGAPLAAAVVLTLRRARRWAAGLAALGVLAVAAPAAVRPPAPTPEIQFRLHRGDLTALAADFRAGWLTGDVDLPWRMRFLSIDGQAHRRCGETDERGRKQCALYLQMWQDWRAENGGGLAYYPDAPGPDAAIATASGDIGGPVRALGDGWWWID